MTTLNLQSELIIRILTQQLVSVFTTRGNAVSNLQQLFGNFGHCIVLTLLHLPASFHMYFSALRLLNLASYSYIKMFSFILASFSLISSSSFIKKSMFLLSCFSSSSFAVWVSSKCLILSYASFSDSSVLMSSSCWKVILVKVGSV